MGENRAGVAGDSEHFGEHWAQFQSPHKSRVDLARIFLVLGTQVVAACKL
jgi:hypothetical protein